MKPLPHTLLDRLDLKAAAAIEVDGSRSLLPPEPNWKIQGYDSLIERSIRSALSQGVTIRPPVQVAVRKSRHGLRPVPIMGILERVTYAALVEAATGSAEVPAAGAKEWLEFTLGPISEAENTSTQKIGSNNLFFPFATNIKYVVKSDVVAFYRHIDHEWLRDQLTLKGGDYQAITYLIDFLGELQERAVGLPQVNRSSDVLANIYIDAVERSMVRRGYPIWRFSDDFRIACTNYTSAMKAIEDLDRSLRRMGLTLNEAKTTTPTYANYYLDSMGLEESGGGVTLKQEEAEDIVGDYTDDFSQDPDSAAAFLNSLTSAPPDDSQISLQNAGQAEMRMARRALSGLARNRDPRGISAIPDLVRYMAPVTPSAMRYLTRLGRAKKARTKIAEALDELAWRAATNDWQKAWLIHSYNESTVLTLKRSRSARIDWIRSQMHQKSNQMLSAYATWILASAGELTSKDILSRLDDSPAVLGIFYAAAMAQTHSNQQQRDAFGDPLLSNMASSK